MRCTTCRQTRGPFVYMANGKDYCEGCAPRCGTWCVSDRPAVAATTRTSNSRALSRNGRDERGWSGRGE